MASTGSRAQMGNPEAITKDGEPFLITGSPGGSAIITTVVQGILNVIDHDMTIEDAVSVPRFHHQWQPDWIFHATYGFSPDTLGILESMGHKNFRTFPSSGYIFGDANSILFKDGVIHGIKDPRNFGVAVGF